MPTSTEQQKTNKHLEEIKKILHSGMTPADQKKLAEEQLKAATEMAKEGEKRRKSGDASDKLKQAGDKLKQAGEKDEKQKDSRHKQATSLWGMLKNDVTKWATKSNENQITWGNLGGVIKNSVKNWFKEVAKTNTLLGRTFRVGAAIWNNVFVKIGQRFAKTMDAVKSEIVDVLGPGIMGIIGIMKNTLLAAWETTKNFFGSIFQGFKRVPPGDRKRNKFLRGILHELIKQRKGDFIEGLGSKKPKGASGFLGRLAGIFGLIGPLLIGKIVLGITAFILLVIGLWKAIKTTISTKGSWADKFKAGWMAFLKFIWGIPLSIVEWLLVKVFKWEGATGLKDKVFNIVGGIIDTLVDFTIGPILDFFESFFSTEGGFIKKIKAAFMAGISGKIKAFTKWGGKLLEVISPIFEGIVNFFRSFWNTMVNWMISKIPSWMPGKDAIKQSVAGMAFNMAEAGAASQITDEQARAYQKRAGLQNVPLNEIKDLMAETNARMEAGQRETAVALVQSAKESGGYKTEVKAHPEEVDGSAALIFSNNDADFAGG